MTVEFLRVATCKMKEIWICFKIYKTFNINGIYYLNIYQILKLCSNYYSGLYHFRPLVCLSNIFADTFQRLISDSETNTNYDRLITRCHSDYLLNLLTYWFVAIMCIYVDGLNPVCQFTVQPNFRGKVSSLLYDWYQMQASVDIRETWNC